MQSRRNRDSDCSRVESTMASRRQHPPKYGCTDQILYWRGRTHHAHLHGGILPDAHGSCGAAPHMGTQGTRTMGMVWGVEALSLEQGEDVLVSHEEVTRHEHELKVHRVGAVTHRHGLEEALHGQALYSSSQCTDLFRT